MKRTRLLEAALGTYWAITPEGLQGLIELHDQIIQRTGSISSEDIKALMEENEEVGYSFHIMDSESSAVVKRGRPMAGTSYVNLYDDGVAVLNLFGPIFPRANMMGMSTEGMSLEKMCRDFAMAYTDPDVNAIVLNADTPGGDARGLGDAADFMFNLTQKGKKPFLAFASGYMASAGYYLSAPAHKIIASKSGMVGSIGTVSKVSTKDDGTLDIVSSVSPKKRPDYSTEEGRATVQQRVDDLGMQFAGDVAKYRGVTLEKVLADYGQGDYMFGPRAKSQGLVDGIGTLASVVEMAAKLAKDKSGASFHRKAQVKSDVDMTQIVSTLDVDHFSQEINMSLKSILAKFAPATADLLDDKGKAPATAANESDTDVAGVVVDDDAGSDKEPVVVPTREELEEEFSTHAELFATQMTVDSRILPALQGHAASDLLNAMIDDKLHGGEINYVDGKGQVVAGTREAAVRSRYSVMPKHNMTQEAIKGIKDGTQTAKVLPAIDAETVKTDGPVDADRRKELLAKSDQGQAVLATSK
jgi:ClpP class serine protease